MAERFYRRLASFARVVLVDRRGAGLSDPLRSVYAGGDFGPWLEEAVSDFVTVLDAIGSERAAVVANRYGTTVAISLAATHPDRVAAMVLVDPLVCLLATEDYPWGMPPELRDQAAHTTLLAWGEGMMSGVTPSYRGPGAIPSFRHDAEAHRWLARYERAGLPRGQLAAWWRDWDFDVRPLLPSIQAPTLIMRHEGNVFVPPQAAINYVTATIPGAVGPVPIPSATWSCGRRSHRCWPTRSSGSSRGPPPSTSPLPSVRSPSCSISTSSGRPDKQWRWGTAAGASSWKSSSAPAAGRSSDTVADWSSPPATGSSRCSMPPPGRFVVRTRSSVTYTSWVVKLTRACMPVRSSCSETTSQGSPCTSPRVS